MAQSVTMPARIFEHPVFKRNRLMRIGAYAWLCANQPVRAPIRTIAREWGIPHATVLRVIKQFADHGLLELRPMKQWCGRHPRSTIYVVPWRRVPAWQPNLTDGPQSGIRKRVFSRDNYRCVYCGSAKQLELDHVEPRVNGGATVISNLVTACSHCNRTKWARTPQEWNGDEKKARGLYRGIANDFRASVVSAEEAVFPVGSVAMVNQQRGVEANGPAACDGDGASRERTIIGEHPGIGDKVEMAEIKCGLFPAATSDRGYDNAAARRDNANQDSNPDSAKDKPNSHNHL